MCVWRLTLPVLCSISDFLKKESKKSGERDSRRRLVEDRFSASDLTVADSGVAIDNTEMATTEADSRDPKSHTQDFSGRLREQHQGNREVGNADGEGGQRSPAESELRALTKDQLIELLEEKNQRIACDYPS